MKRKRKKRERCEDIEEEDGRSINILFPTM